MTLLLLPCASSLLAGFIDAVVGGGGLIVIPAMLLLLPNTPIATILATNKFASCAGTAIAVQRYARHVEIDWPTILPAALTAFAFSFLGSRTVTLLPTEFLRPIVLILLVVVAIAKGSRFARIFFLVIVCALIAKLAQSILAA